MWKEKYEALKKEFEAFRRAVAMDAAAANNKNTGKYELAQNGDLEGIYRFVRGKLAQEIQAGDGILAHVLRDVPEIEVKRIRRKLEMSDTETPGRIAVLISEKFFDSPQNSGQVTKEFKRRGWFSVKTSNAAVLRPLADIAEMGFLTRDGSNYQAVPGMKVNIVEA